MKGSNCCSSDDNNDYLNDGGIISSCTDGPDACGNESRHEKLLERQRKDDGRKYWQRVLDRDRNIIIAILIMMILMNMSTGRYVLYPFKIFSTWVHEMCHGIAALLVGGRIAKLEIFSDGSGLAYTSTSGENWKRGWVSSGGYPGTAFAGTWFLLFRRTTLGPTIGTISLGITLLLSVMLYVRNTFGIICLCIEGIVLLLCGWLLPATILDYLFAFLGATCSMNAVDNIQDLFGSGQGYAGGQPVSSDAHTVADVWGGSYLFWATLWFVMAIILTIIGIFGAFDASENPWWFMKNKNGNSTTTTTTSASSSSYTPTILPMMNSTNNNRRFAPGGRSSVRSESTTANSRTSTNSTATSGRGGNSAAGNSVTSRPSAPPQEQDVPTAQVIQIF